MNAVTTKAGRYRDLLSGYFDHLETMGVDPEEMHYRPEVVQLMGIAAVIDLLERIDARSSDSA